ncbi:cation diffusion facilitator family transporter [Tardiphaga sp.]|jgi:cobalt-zinc-cadmium efflux system protein|uniref:cation diffusion facilitator family transporter n=1 Tax=Tardiphaga sp. TaxID=1926292 RepID=UPI0037DA0DC3
MAHDHNHDHAHDHDDHAGHSHGPGGHVHAPANFGKAFAIGITLNTIFVVVEAVYGYAAGSMALVADAGHNLSDVLGLIAAWTAAVLSKRAATPRFTYGLKGSSILAALFNAVFLLVAVGAIAWEAVHRLFNPEPVTELTVIVVATIGIAINGVTAWLFASGRDSDLNIRGAYLHMVADAAVSVGVVIAAIVIMFTGWLWIDAVTSLVICVLIVWGTWSLLRDSTAMSLAAVPRGIDPVAVRAYLEKCPGVAQVHDLHIWPMSTTEVALTCHLVIPTGAPGDAYLMDICARLKRDFGIEHTTIQIETDMNSACALATAH